MSKFNIFTIDLRVILWIIVATGVYALLLKFLQENSPHRCSNERGGVKGFLNNVKKKRNFSLGMASLRTFNSQSINKEIEHKKIFNKTNKKSKI